MHAGGEEETEEDAVVEGEVGQVPQAARLVIALTLGAKERREEGGEERRGRRGERGEEQKSQFSPWPEEAPLKTLDLAVPSLAGQCFGGGRGGGTSKTRTDGGSHLQL